MPHLSPRENYLRAVRFRGPEYVPNARHLPIVSVGYNGVNPEDGRPDGAIESWDFWGVRWQQELPDVMPFPQDSPLRQVERWSDYSWPDPRHPDRIAASPNRHPKSIETRASSPSAIAARCSSAPGS